MRHPAVLALTLTIGIAGALLLLSGCSGGGVGLDGFSPKPFVMDGNASSVEIGYSGDVAGALPVARRHCAQFERVPRLSATTLDSAFYDCVRPGGGS